MRTRTAGIAAAATTPFVVLFARSFRTSWLATTDFALIELRARAVGGAHTPLIGPYSRFGWNHPGPALFFALAAPYRLLASRSPGLLAGAALIGAVATVTVVVVLLRAPIPRVVALFGVLVTAVLARALGSGFLWNPWNPYVIVLPFLALALLSWWAATGEDRALPVAVAFASFVAQTHVSLAPEAAALLALALAWLLATVARERVARRRLVRSLIVSVGVFGVIWLPPIIQQAQPHGGNLRALWQFWTTSHHDTLGFATGARLLSPQLSIPAPWFTGHEHAEPFGGTLHVPHLSFPFALVALIVAVVVAWRRGDRIGLIACSFAATVVLVAWISFARIVGVPFPYLVRWAWVVGALCWFATGVALLPALAERLGRSGEAWLARAAAAGVAVLLVAVTAGAFTADPPDVWQSDASRVLVAQAVPRLRDLPGPVLVVSTSPGYDASSLWGGVIVGAVEHGIDARYPATAAANAGDDRVVETSAAHTRVVVALDDDVAAYARNPAYREIARYDGLTRSDRREFDRLMAELHRVDASSFRKFIADKRAELERFNSLGKRTIVAAVFVRISKS